MLGRTKSVPALESHDGNWVISTVTRNQQIYAVPKSRAIKSTSNGEYEHSARSMGESTNGVARTKFIKASDHRTGGYRMTNDYQTQRIKKRNQRNRSVDRIGEYISTEGNRGSKHQPRPREVILCKSDGDFGFTIRQISSSMYGRRHESDFVPTSRVPALQRLNVIDPGSLADRGGLRSGDFILEINDEYVARSSHQRIVHLIKNSGNALKIKVIEGLRDDDDSTLNHSIASSRHRRDRYADKTDINNNSNNSRSHDWQNGNETLRRGRHRTTVETGSPDPISSRSSPGLSQSDAVSVVSGSTRTAQKQPSVANIRLSRIAANDQVYYVSDERGRRRHAPRDSHSVTPDSREMGRASPQRLTSNSSSIASTRSHPTANRKRYNDGTSGEPSSIVSGDVGKVADRDVIQTYQNEVIAVAGADTGSDELKLDDVAHTYDVIRARDVPFETDEGYIGLSENVDYVEQEPEKVNFLEMAERVRQIYLRTKSNSQAQQ